MARFTMDQEKFIVTTFCKLGSIQKVRGAFFKAFNIAGRTKTAYTYSSFRHVWSKFNKNGIQVLKTGLRAKNPTPEKTEKNKGLPKFSPNHQKYQSEKRVESAKYPQLSFDEFYLKMWENIHTKLKKFNK